MSYIVVERYDYIVNGEAESEIQEFMAKEHSFEEYTVVDKSYISWKFISVIYIN